MSENPAPIGLVEGFKYAIAGFFENPGREYGVQSCVYELSTIGLGIVHDSTLVIGRPAIVIQDRLPLEDYGGRRRTATVILEAMRFHVVTTLDERLPKQIVKELVGDILDSHEAPSVDVEELTPEEQAQGKAYAAISKQRGFERRLLPDENVQFLYKALINIEENLRAGKVVDAELRVFLLSFFL